MDSPVLTCPDCSYVMGPTDHFCSQCGSGAAFAPQTAVPYMQGRAEPYGEGNDSGDDSLEVGTASGWPNRPSPAEATGLYVL